MKTNNLVIELKDGVQLEVVARVHGGPRFTHFVKLSLKCEKALDKAIRGAYVSELSPEAKKYAKLPR